MVGPLKRLLVQYNTSNTHTKYINKLRKPERIHKVRIVRLLREHIMKTQNNTVEKPREKLNGKNAEINKETSLLFPIQHRPFIIGNPLKWFISFKTWCMCINDLWISNNFSNMKTSKNARKRKREREKL